MAVIIGLAIFFIWWFTGRSRPDAVAGTPSPKPGSISKEAILEAALPRGGSLTGTTNAMDLAAERLTAAPLVRVNRSTDQLEPWLAESWTASPDNLIYTLRLRPGVTAADGTALTAARAVESLGEMTVLEKPVTLRAVDPVTVEIRFASPFAPGLRVLDRHPVAGFGPFVESPGKKPSPSKIPVLRTFTRNANYWHKAAD